MICHAAVCFNSIPIRAPFPLAFVQRPFYNGIKSHKITASSGSWERYISKCSFSKQLSSFTQRHHKTIRLIMLIAQKCLFWCSIEAEYWDMMWNEKSLCNFMVCHLDIGIRAMLQQTSVTTKSDSLPCFAYRVHLPLLELAEVSKRY